MTRESFLTIWFSLGVGLPVGVLGAIGRGRRWDHAGLALTTLLGAIPSFVLAFVLLLVFAVWLDLFDVRLGKGFGDSVGSLPNGVLPAIALAATRDDSRFFPRSRCSRATSAPR